MSSPAETFPLPGVIRDREFADAPIDPDWAFSEQFDDDQVDQICETLSDIFDDHPPVMRPDIDGEMKVHLWLPALAQFSGLTAPHWTMNLSDFLIHYAQAAPFELDDVISELERITDILKRDVEERSLPKL